MSERNGRYGSCLLDKFVADLEFRIVDKSFYVLFVGFRTDHQYVVVVDNDVLLQSLDHGQFVGSGLDDTPFGVVQHAAFGGYIAVLVLRGVAVERTPCADIGPPTLAAADIYIFGLLHNPEINRNVAALGVDLLDILCLLWGGIIRRNRREHLCQVRKVALQSCENRRYLPDEDSRIPKKLPALDKRTGQLFVGLLRKGLYFMDRTVGVAAVVDLL